MAGPENAYFIGADDLDPLLTDLVSDPDPPAADGRGEPSAFPGRVHLATIGGPVRAGAAHGADKFTRDATPAGCKELPMIDVAVVGLGKMGLSHLSMIQAHPDVNLVGVCDSTGYLLDVLGKYTGVRRTRT